MFAYAVSSELPANVFRGRRGGRSYPPQGESLHPKQLRPARTATGQVPVSRGKLGVLLQEHLDLVELVSGELQLRGPLCPDFVIELRSPSDPLATLQAKMREYVENGAPGLAA